MPEPNVKKMAASALEYFKDSSEQNAEVYLALPQSNSVLGSLNKMNKRLKGEEEILIVPLPIYPKGFKLASFAALNSKPWIFHQKSYVSLNPFIALDPPSVGPGLKDIVRQSLSLPSSQLTQYSTLESSERLARAGIQIASHCELFL